MSAVLDSLAFVFVVSVVLVIMIELIKGLFRNGLERRLDALLRVEAKIDLLLEHAGIEFDPYKRFPQEVVEALDRGEKIRAIKLWRVYAGASLKQAKDFIEEFQRRKV